jgi:hypothetical protein
VCFASHRSTLPFFADLSPPYQSLPYRPSLIVFLSLLCPPPRIVMEEHSGASTEPRPGVAKSELPVCLLCGDPIKGPLKVITSPHPKGSITTRAHKTCIRQRTRSNTAVTPHVAAHLGAPAAAPRASKRKRRSTPADEFTGEQLYVPDPFPVPAIAAAAVPLPPFEQSTVTASSSKGPLYDLANDPLTMFNKYGYAIIRATAATRAFAGKIVRMPISKAPKVAKDSIAGDVTQVNLSVVREFTEDLRNEWHEIMREAAKQVGIKNADALYIQAEKLLAALSEKGEQALHCDRDDDPEKLRQVFTVILYCSPGVHSTSFPRFTPDQFALPRFDVEDNVLNQADLQRTVRCGLLDEDVYHRCDVEVGDIAIFPQSIPHAGTRNPSSLTRIALFSILTPFQQPNQDNYQIFRWMYIEKAFGGDSLELAEAVYHDRQHDPLGRFSSGKQIGREAKEIHIQNLIRWNYITYHPDTKRVEWKPRNEHRHGPLEDDQIITLYTGKSASVRKRQKS